MMFEMSDTEYALSLLAMGLWGMFIGILVGIVIK